MFPNVSHIMSLVTDDLLTEYKVAIRCDEQKGKTIDYLSQPHSSSSKQAMAEQGPTRALSSKLV